MTPCRPHVVCACLLAWNILFPVFWCLESEAIAVARTSAKYEAVKDNGEYRRLFEQDMDAARERTGHYFYALGILAAVNGAALVFVMARLQSSSRKDGD